MGVIYLRNFGTSATEPIMATWDVSEDFYNWDDTSGVFYNETRVYYLWRILDNGGSNITSYGIVIDTNENPDINAPIKRIIGNTNPIGVNIDTRVRASDFTPNLLPYTTYYMRAYTTNAVGTSYLPQKIFVTGGDNSYNMVTLHAAQEINSQIWTKWNWSAIEDTYGGLSVIYPAEDITITKTLGNLYNWNDAMRLVPEGWHIPTKAEFDALIDYVGDDTNAGGILKGTDRYGAACWDFPKTGATNDPYRFTTKGTGHKVYGSSAGELRRSQYFWLSNNTATTATTKKITYNSAAITEVEDNKINYCSVRLIKGGTAPIISRYIDGDDFYNNNFITIFSKFNIISNQGSPITEYGVLIKKGSAPTISSYDFKESIEDDNYIGLAEITIDGNSIAVDTYSTYYIKPFAINSIGTVYGDTRIFITLNEINITGFTGINIISTEQIGTQLWTKFNCASYKDNTGTITDCKYPNNVEGNVEDYGYLYKWSESANLAPNGWHLPSKDEFDTLSTYLGGEFGAGIKIKESGTIYWNSPNTGTTNSAKFYSRGTGFYDSITYNRFKDEQFLWTSTNEGIDVYLLQSYHDRDDITISKTLFTTGDYASIRLIQGTLPS